MVTIHVFAVLFAFVVVLVADRGAVAWMRGKEQVMNAGRVRRLHALTWTGLAVLIVSGSMIAYPMLGYLLLQPLFIMKLLFVGVLVVNAILIGKLSQYAVREPFSKLNHHDRMRLIMSGVVSSFSWISVVILALLFFK